MTREMYESISLHDLREIAKNRGMRRISALKKADLIDAMLKKDEEEAKAYREERLQRRQELASRDSAQGQTGAASRDGAQGQNWSASQDSAQGQAARPASQDSAQGQTRPASQDGAQVQDGPQAQDRARSQGKRIKTNTGAYSSTGRRQNTRPRREIAAAGGRQARPVRQPQGGFQTQDRSRINEQTQDRIRANEQTQDRIRPNDQIQDRIRNNDQAQDRIRMNDQVQDGGRSRGWDQHAEAGAGQGEGSAQESFTQGMEKPAPVVRENPGLYTYTQQAQNQGGQPVPGQTQQTRNSQDPQADPQGSRPARYFQSGRQDVPVFHRDELNTELDSGQMANGILEVMQDGFGFIRCANYMPGENDIYVAPSQIRRFGLKTGDIISGNIRVKTQGEKFSALLYVKSVNGYSPDEATKRYNFEDMTPVFPDERIRLERAGGSISMRIMDLMCPVGKGQRGMIVSPPKAGKTTLIKDVARSVKYNNPEIHLIVLLIDERPEEVTDIREAIEGDDAEVIYSTFDELPEHHKRVSEMAIERARRLVEHKRDVMILLDSITRLTRAYNITEPPSGRTLSGGLDPAALHMPKRFFGAARSMREGGSLTILATALIDTGSKMDDIVFEEFKGTGNMELVLDRRLSERRIFPAIDIVRSGTRRDDLLLTPDELAAINIIRRAFNGLSAEQAVTQALDLFSRTRTNGEFVNMVRKIQWGKE